MALITSSSFDGLRSFFRRGNDRYTMTPDLGYNVLNMFSKEAQFISITDQESEILRTTPQLFAVIYRRAQMIANGKWMHLNKDGDEIENSPFVKLLEMPNAFQAGNEWLIQQDVQKSTYGNTFIFMLKGSKLAEVPSALWNLTPKDITVERTGKIWKQTNEADIIKSYKINVDKTSGKFDDSFEPREILHRNWQDVDDPIVGRSPLHAIKMPISNVRAAYGFRNVIMTEKGALGMLSNQSKSTAGAIPLTEKEREKIEKQFARSYGINSKQRKVIMSSASLKWNPMSYPTKDMMLFEEVDDDFRAIIDLYGMNEAIFSLGKGTTFDNYETGEKSAYQDTIIPEAMDLANGLTKKFGLMEKDEKLVLDYSHIPILQADQELESNIIKNRADATQVLMNSGIYTAEEIKDIIKFNV